MSTKIASPTPRPRRTRVVNMTPESPAVSDLEYLHRDYLNVNQAAQLLGISVGTLISWRQKNVGPPFAKIGKGTVVYRRSDIDQYVADRLVIVDEETTNDSEPNAVLDDKDTSDG